ncbi:MAG: hypothetical protein ONB16_03190 [candidate division KSB1 bacterium]|nr:hypothetical protein [candidate division KSB1 bacterium]MDZ7317627.1 hypothetical protein [candidate division KSB1 bacterium]MDZ7340850.1 hypothetical protein [candidate division KSB1 bacterium]
MSTKIIMFSIGMLMALIASFVGLVIAWVSYNKHKKATPSKGKGE